MRPTRKCELCGKTFVPRSGMQKYCSEECQAEAKRLRKKRQQDLINGIEPIMDVQHQEYVTFSKSAIAIAYCSSFGAEPCHPALFSMKETPLPFTVFMMIAVG